MKTTALDEIEHRKAMQQLAAMQQRTQNSGAKVALVKIQTWKEENKRPEPPKRIKLNPPAIVTKSVVDGVRTGAVFKAYRESLGIAPVEVYKRAGLTKEKFHGLERGQKKWDTKIRRKICDAIYDIVAAREDAKDAAAYIK